VIGCSLARCRHPAPATITSLPSRQRIPQDAPNRRQLFFSSCTNKLSPCSGWWSTAKHAVRYCLASNRPAYSCAQNAPDQFDQALRERLSFPLHKAFLPLQQPERHAAPGRLFPGRPIQTCLQRAAENQGIRAIQVQAGRILEVLSYRIKRHQVQRRPEELQQRVAFQNEIVGSLSPDPLYSFQGAAQ